MRQFRFNRTHALLSGLVLSSLAGSSHAAFPFLFQDEDAALFTSMRIGKDPVASSATVTTLGANQPVLCANLRNESSNARIAPVFPGIFPGSDFKFGSMIGGQTGSLSGVASWNFSPQRLVVHPQANLLSCYVLSSGGIRKLSAGLFTDAFDQNPGADAKISTRVLALPNSDFPDYRYLVDVTIPSAYAGRNYVVRDGFDSSVFDTGQSQYCTALALTDTLCGAAPVFRNSIDEQGVVPANGLSRRFIVRRPLHSGIFALPSDPTLMLTAAAVFVDDNGLDRDLSNNISVGRGVLSDLSPNILVSPTMVPVLPEGNGVTGLTFQLTDDTSEVGLPQLNADISIDFNGNVVPAVNASCSQLDVPQPGEVVRRTCRFDIPSFDPNFATDVTSGTYANGVYANVRIVATDGRNQVSTRYVPFHVAPGDNDAPTFSLDKLAEPDPTNGNRLTLTCDLATGRGFSEQCLGELPSFVIDRKPAPPRAYDELASQTAFFAGVGADNKLNCTGSLPTIFANGGVGVGVQVPKFTYNGSLIGLDYAIAGNVNGYSDCWVTVGDNGSPYTQYQVQFRIKVINAP
jgi:hypothetical protein